MAQLILALIVSGIVAGLSAALGALGSIPEKWRTGRIYKLYIRPALTGIIAVPMIAGTVLTLVIRQALIWLESRSILLNSVAFVAGAVVAYAWARARGRHVYMRTVRFR